MVKKSQYKFKPVRQVVKLVKGSNEKRIFSKVSIQDIVVQKAIALILEMIYEKNKVFLDVSHGFRKQRSSHTAVRQIKEKWVGVPFYIEADINKVFGDVNRNILINLLKRRISDKRLCDLIFQMYRVGVLGSEGFWTKKR